MAATVALDLLETNVTEQPNQFWVSRKCNISMVQVFQIRSASFLQAYPLHHEKGEKIILTLQCAPDVFNLDQKVQTSFPNFYDAKHKTSVKKNICYLASL